MFWVLFGWLVD